MPLGLSSNLFNRIVSALTLLPVVLGLVYMGGWWFFGLLAVGGLLMFKEWCALTGVTSKVIIQMQAVTIVALTASFTYTAGAFSVPLFGLLLGLSVLLLFSPPTRLAERAGSASPSVNAYVGAAYVLLALLSLTWLRNVDENGLIVIWLFFAVWAMDVGGYFAGKGIGGPKLAPKLSPNKTWAGLIGGMALAGIVSAAISALFGLKTPFLLSLAGILVAVVAQMGDLYESAIKRALNAKDSGNLIPGHGGILDRVDGLVFAAPAVMFAMVIPMLFEGTL